VYTLTIVLPSPLDQLISLDSLEDLNGTFNFLLQIKRACEELVQAWVALNESHNAQHWRLLQCMSSVLNELQHHLQHDICESAMVECLASARDDACTNLRAALRRVILGLVADSALSNRTGRLALNQVVEHCQAFAKDVLEQKDLDEYDFNDFALAVRGLIRVLSRMNHQRLVERIDYSGFWRSGLV